MSKSSEDYWRAREEEQRKHNIEEEKAYQKETGIAGYTLIYNSYGLRLVAHEPFESTEAAIAKENDIHSETTVVQRVYDRYLVGDTDAGRELREQIADLERLLAAYRNGEITEKI